MKMDVLEFLPRHQKVVAFPNWNSPRLVVQARGISGIFQYRSLFTPSTTLGRIRRDISCLLAGLALLPIKEVSQSNEDINRFLKDVACDSRPDAIVIGRQGSAQKITIRISNSSGQVTGYIKYAESTQAKERLLKEYSILTSLPTDVAPKAIKMGDLAYGIGLLLSNIDGRLMPTTLNLDLGIADFVSCLSCNKRFPLYEHPWIKAFTERHPGSKHWMVPLAERNWPVVFMHGDLAPWNLLKMKDGSVRGIDWESGCIDGFPYIDLSYYFLRISALVFKMKPKKAAQMTSQRIRQFDPSLGKEEADVLVRLTAMHEIDQRFDEGWGEKDFLLHWYREMEQEV